MSPPDPAHGRGNRRFHAGNNGTLYVAGETLYKVATNERSGQRLRRESRLLAHIAGRLAAPVPVPVEVLWDEHDSAPVTVKYRLIHGKELPCTDGSRRSMTETSAGAPSLPSWRPPRLCRQSFVVTLLSDRGSCPFPIRGMNARTAVRYVRLTGNS